MSVEPTPEERRRLESLFERAANLEPQDRETFVLRECAAGSTLERQLRRMLDAPDATDPLERVQAGRLLAAGTRIGPYQLLEKLGEGGMGEVYKALQREPVRRTVALKVIRAGIQSEQTMTRFEAERQALARMSHPSVARVFDAGTTADGRHYFAMELVEGEPTHDFCDRRQLTTRERVELLIAICEGVQHAHQKGIIHRDLKPSNLLVTEVDGRPTPKIIDFGIARATSGRIGERSLHTEVGQIIGTLDYMSPEQADPTAVDIDTRSDIYSLGVVLYQLVSGILPFDLSSTGFGNLFETQRILREQDPQRPSTRLRQQGDSIHEIALRHGTDARSLVRGITGDLDWIALKALEKDPARRYASASELAQDLRRHLADEPVLAGKPGTLYRVRKFVRRHRLPLAAAAIAFVGAVLGIAGIVSGRRVAQTMRPQADEYAVRSLLMRSDDLWPPYPVGSMLEDLEQWIADARVLAARLPHYRRKVGAGPGPDERAFMQDLLTALVAELEQLGDADSGLLAREALLPGRGWSIPRRLAFAREVQRAFSSGGEYHAEWEGLQEEIRLTSWDVDGDGTEELPYANLRLPPQLGLVPLGPDPRSGLWEFAHWMTGEPPRRDGRGQELVLNEQSALVLVLIPGGSFRMGSPGNREGGDATPHDVDISPFFLSKYEMTQGQWKRLTGSNPSRYGPDMRGTWHAEWLESGAGASGLLPVEQISWSDCMQWLPRADLTLPSEAQWEYAARAGTTTSFWTGDSPDSLEGAANISDMWARQHGGKGHQQNVDWSDGSTMQWPIGGHRANPFGLEDVHGNLYEWCLDGYDDLGDFYSTSPRLDPVAFIEGDAPRVHRGGSYRSGPGVAASHVRSYYPPDMSGHALGVRPARAIHGTDGSGD